MTNTPEETIKKNVEKIINGNTKKIGNLIAFIIQRLVTIGALIIGIIYIYCSIFYNAHHFTDGAIFIALYVIMSLINSLADSFYKFSDAVCSSLSAMMNLQRVQSENNRTSNNLSNLHDIINKMGATGIEFQMLDEDGQPLSPEKIEEMKKNDPFFKMLSKMKDDLENNPALKDIIERRINNEAKFGKGTNTDYKYQSKDGLDKMLKDAITKEDYELAAIIQEEIKRRTINE